MSGIAKRIGVTFGVVVAIIVGIKALGAALDVYNSRPQKVTSFESINLGASMDEVAYALGEPTTVARLGDWELADGTIEKDIVIDVLSQEVEKHKQRFKGYVYWRFAYSDRRIDVNFDKDTKVVTSIGCYVNPDAVIRGVCWTNGIRDGNSEEMVTERLGQPTRSSIDSYSNVKTLEYDNWNMEIRLKKRVVYYIKVHVKKG